MGITLFVGGHPGTVQGEREDLTGNRMFTAAHKPALTAFPDIQAVNGYIDSGAFSDPPDKRLTPEQALKRQLAFEIRANEKWSRYGYNSGNGWQASALVSYDLLIDETWVGGKRHKRRWSIRQADYAVRKTIESARYLASMRTELEPRQLILSAQGVDSIQYRDCLKDILKVSTPQDIIGFGGWCILGNMSSWLPEFFKTVHTCLPLTAQAGIRRVHIFGVLYQPALGPMLYVADQYGIEISTDSTAPIKATLWKTKAGRKKAGCRVKSGYWKDNVEWWKKTLGNLRGSVFYREPPREELSRQLEMFG